MFSLATLMNTGWQVVQSTLSTIGGVLFSRPPQSKTKRRPIGLDQLVQTKGYWVDRQREVFAELHEDERLATDTMRSALDMLLGQLGARLGSPAVMLVELARLRETLTKPQQFDVVDDTVASIQASMIKDPKVAHACLIADIQLLVEETSMKFINSAEGREWLVAYRPFFRPNIFQEALVTIEEYANRQLGQLYQSLKSVGKKSSEIRAKFQHVQAELTDFHLWLDNLKHQPVQSIEPMAWDKVRSWDDASVKDEKALKSSAPKNLSPPSISKKVAKFFTQLINLPVRLLSRYPRLSGGLLLATKAAVVFARAQRGHGIRPDSLDVSSVFTSENLSQGLSINSTNVGNLVSVQDVTRHYSRRHLQESDTCFNGVKESSAWMQTFGAAPSGIQVVGQIDADSAISVAIRPTGEIVMVGYTESYGAGGEDVLLVQYSDDGSFDWAKSYGGSSDERGTSVAFRSDGKLVLGGYTKSYGAGSNDVLLAQLGTDGELEWAQTLGGSSFDRCFSVAVDDSGKIVLVGESWSYGPGQSAVLVAQYHSDGNLEWAHALGGNDYDRGVGVAIGLTGKRVIAGFTESYGAGGRDVLLAQYSEDGHLDWAQTLGGSDYDEATGVTISPLGQIILVGHTQSYGAGSYDVLLAQYSTGGSLEWAQTLGGDSIDRGFGVATSPAGKIVLVGETASFVADSYFDVLLAQYSVGGDLEWAQTLGGSDYDAGTSVAIGDWEQTVIVGETENFGTSIKAYALVLKIDQTGVQDSLASVANPQVVTNLVMTEQQETISNYSIVIVPENLTSTISSTQQVGLSFEQISSEAVTIYSAVANQTNNQAIEVPTLTEEYFVQLDGLFLSTSFVENADLLNADWLYFDKQAQQLIGTPLFNPLNPIEIPLEVILDNHGGTAKAKLALCVNKYGALHRKSPVVVGGGSGRNYANDVALSSSGQIVLVGSTANYDRELADHDPTDVLLIVYGADSNPKRVLTLGGARNDVGYSVSITPMGHIVVVGSTGSYGAGSEDVLLAQFDSDGHLEWARTLGGPNLDEGSSLAIASNGNIVLVGYTSSYGAGRRDVLLAQYNSAGVFEWAQTLGGSYFEQAKGVAIGPTGKIVLVGFTDSYGAGNYDLLLAQYRVDGSLEWAQTLGGGGLDEGNSVAITPSGNIVLAGYTKSYGSGRSDLLVAQYRDDGHLEWAQTLGGAESEAGYGVAIGQRGQILLTGKVFNTGFGGADMLLAQYRQNGTLLSVHAIGTASADESYGLAVRPNGEVILVGYTNENANYHGSGMLAVNLDPQGGLDCHQSVFQQALLAFTGVDVLPIVNNITDVHLANVTGSSDMAVNLDVDIRESLQSRHVVTNGQYFEIDFKQYFNSFVRIYTLTYDNTPTLPTWLSVDTENLILRGTSQGGEARGQHVIRMDTHLKSGRKWVSFVLDIVNAAPNFTRSPHFPIQVGRFVLPIGSYFEDYEGDFIGPYLIGSVNGTQAEPIASIDQNSGRFFGVALSGDQGGIQFNITAADAHGDLGWKVITLEVTNRPPAQAYDFSNPGPITIGGSPLHYEFPSNAFVDPDGDAVSYQAIVPGFLTFDIAGRVLKGSPTGADSGVHNVYFIARDSYGGSSNVSIIVDVNTPPVLASQIDQVATNLVDQYFEARLASGLFTDPDGDSLAYRLIEDVQHIIPTWLRYNEATRTLSGTPEDNLHQPRPLRFLVEDGRGGSAFFDLDIITPNSLPRVLAGISDQRIDVNQVRSMIVPIDAFEDPDKDVLSYSLSFVSGHPRDWLSLAGNVLTLTPRSGDQGHYELRMGAQDAYGGQTDSIFTIEVPNRSPSLAYEIPEPPEANARELWAFELSADNFADQDQDPLTYEASIANGQPLPTWLRFNPDRRRFEGQPSGTDRGLLPIRLIVTDGHGGSVNGSFNVTVANSAPALPPGERFFDQQASNLDSSLVFTVPELHDPDGDPVIYTAEMLNGMPLPSWIRFDPDTRTFSSRPSDAPPGNYQVVVISRDSEGVEHRESFNLAVSSAPDVPDQGLQAWLQALIPTLSAACLVGAIIAALAWRERRIRRVNQLVMAWARKRQATVRQGITPTQLEEQLDSFQRHLKAGSDANVLEDQYVAFETMARSYYKQDSERERVFTRLVSGSGVLEECVLSIRSMLLEGDTTKESAMVHAFGISSLLHGLFRLLLELHTGRGLIIAKTFKDELSQSISYITSRMDKKTLVGMRIYHNLISCQECMICMLDTEGLGRLFLSMAMHIISPANLLNDLKGIVVDIPAKWYITLLRISQQIGQASEHSKALQTIQMIAAQHADWRFRYGLAPIYVNMLSQMRDDAMQKSLISGREEKGKVIQLGMIHLLCHKSRIWRKNDKRIRVLTQYLLNERTGLLPVHAQTLLKEYLVAQNGTVVVDSSVRRVSRQSSSLFGLGVRRGSLANTSSGMMAASGGGGFIVNNPLGSDLMADPLSALALRSRQARVQHVPQPVRSPSTIIASGAGAGTAVGNQSGETETKPTPSNSV